MDKKIKNTSVSISKNYSFDYFTYLDYEGFLTLERIYDYRYKGEYTEFREFSILTNNLFDDIPMDDESLSKLESSFNDDLDSIIESFPDYFRFVKKLDIVIHNNIFGLTSLEWKFSIPTKKLKKIGDTNILYDFLIEFNPIDFENISETISDINLIKGDSFYEIVSEGDEEDIMYYFNMMIKKNIEFGYEIYDKEYYINKYDIKPEIVVSVLNDINSK